MNKKVNKNEIMQKARKVIEEGRDEQFSKEELNWLQKNGGVIYLAYKRVLEMKKQDLSNELGGKDNER